MEGLHEGGTEVDSDSSSSSLASWDSDSEADFGLGSSEDAAAEDALASVYPCGGDRKRRRLARAKDCGCFGLSILPAAARRTVATEATLIILDWDDTLMPSTWLQEQGLQIVAGSALPSEEQTAVLRGVARCVIRTLRRAKRVGHVTIVTNAEKGWVELSCSKFLPGVFPLLEGIKILSARSTFEHAQPQSPIHWKCMAFRKEITAFFQAQSRCIETGGQRNIVSVGDSLQERAALLQVTEGRDCRAKSLKFEERPSPEQLIKQHRLLTACLRPFVDFEGSLDLCLQVPK